MSFQLMDAHPLSGSFVPMSLLTLSFTLVQFLYARFTVEDPLEVCHLSMRGKA
jgi:hypothetical protein